MSSTGRSVIVPGHPGRVAGMRKLAYFTNQLPFPPYSGGQVRESQILTRTSGQFAIDLVIVTANYDRDVAHVDQALPYCRSVAIFEARPDPALAPALPERVWMYRNDDALPYVAGLIASGEVDIVHSEGYFLVQHIPANLPVPLLVYEENIEYELDRENQRLCGRGRFAAWTVSREMEQAAWGRATAVATVAAEDLAVVRGNVLDLPLFWLPSGCDHFQSADIAGGGLATAGPDERRVVYTANFDWPPSRDGAFQVIDEIWPRVRAAVPPARLVLAGAGDGGQFAGRLAADPSIQFLGPLPSFGPLLASAAVLVCPLRFGSGFRTKIAEALYLGCPIVTTAIGWHGIPEVARQAMCYAETPDALAEHVIRLLTDPALRAELRERAARAGRELHTWATAAEQISCVWSWLAGERNPEQMPSSAFGFSSREQNS
jgi:glycosyltransferase involved in cell wall biosynthesis